MSEAMPPLTREAKRAAGRLAGVAFVTAAAALVLAYLAVAVPGAWFPAVSPVRYEARAMDVVAGTARLDGRTVVLAPQPPATTVTLSAATALRAADYPGLAWEVSGLPPGTVAKALWRDASTPPRTFTIEVPVTAAGRLAALTIGDDGNWRGRITGLALVLSLPPSGTARIDGVTAQTLSAAAVLGARAREWLQFETWSGSSINTVVIGTDLLELPLPALLGLAATLAAFVVLAAARWRRPAAAAALPGALAAMFLAATLLLDAQWQWSLVRQVRATAAEFGGKTLHEKHRASDDGPLFDYIERVRARLPAAPARVFMLADAAYFRGRGAYHLYPHNVYFDPFGNLTFPASALRAGDHVVVYFRRGVAYDPAARRLLWDGGPPVAADVLHHEPGAGLYVIR